MVQKALAPLSGIQNLIRSRLLAKVEAPHYLQGGLCSTPECPRGVLANARMHARSPIIVDEDVASFFDSIHSRMVFKMWKEVFRCANRVAELLTRLTTYAGALPKGASTSSHIANFVLFDVEPELEADLARQGCRYSRFVDDLTISSAQRMSGKEITASIAAAAGMLARKGLHFKRSKHSIERRSQRQTVNGLVVNGRPRVGIRIRKQLRAAIHQQKPNDARPVDPEALERIVSKIGYVASIDSATGEKLRRQLGVDVGHAAVKRAMKQLALTRKHKTRLRPAPVPGVELVASEDGAKIPTA